jgi:Na+/H+ antiporter NhaD/arsenite permease-like protein
VTEQQTSPGQEHESQPSKLLYPVAFALLIILAFYGYLIHQGLPQKWTEQSNAVHVGGDQEEENAAHADGNTHDNVAEHDETVKHHPPIFMVAPFAILLLCIAILPLVPATAHWWESNTSKFLIAAGLGLLTLLYYYLGCHFPVEQHLIEHKIIDPAEVGRFAVAKTVFMNAIVAEFLPFIVLLFSLFTITGGIRIAGNLKATPFVNSVILFIGAVLASFIGTTGAAMLLIRLLLETNRERKYKAHTVVMFIFCVCNCGGCLTPLGDPPLFLGYLRGVAFEWTFHLIVEWAFVNLILIAFYFLWDTVWFYWRESKADKQNDVANKTSLSISGWMLNVPLLLGVVAAVAFLDPGKTVPGTDWHPWYYLREAVQLGLAALSLLFGSYTIRKENAFNFLAICEVAALFFGIFICMQAPLQILHEEGKPLVAYAEKATGASKPKLFFWSTGALSSVLDNAPTYVVFYETAKALTPNTDEEKAEWKEEEGKDFRPVLLGNNGDKGQIDFFLLVAVSLGAVFMGSMTYIGNGPNFMVKAIAEQDGVKMPSFFGYMLYSFLILLPLLIVMTILFL